MANACAFTSASVTRGPFSRGVLWSGGPARQIEDLHAAGDLRRLEPVAMGGGVAHVVEAGLPELAHGGARELVVLRVRGVGKAPVDEVRDGDLALLAERRFQQLVVGVVVEAGRELLHE